MQHWIDVSSRKHYGISKATLIEVFDHKLSIVLRARKSWPKHASFEEDCLLRKDKWNNKYTNERVVQWDNANIEMAKPGDAALQRTTYS